MEDLRVLVFLHILQGTLMCFLSLKWFSKEVKLLNFLLTSIVMGITIWTIRGLYHYFNIPLGSHTIVLALLFILLMKILCRMDWASAIGSSVFSFTLIMLGSWCTPVTYKLIGLSFSEALKRPWLHVAMGQVESIFLYLAVLTNRFLGWSLLGALNKRKLQPPIVQKRCLFLIDIILAYPFFVSMTAYNVLYPGFELPLSVNYIISFTLAMISILLIGRIIDLLYKEQEAENTALKLDEAKNLVSVLRSKHHDFMNHLQVIMGLTQLQKHDLVTAYIKDLSSDLGQIEKIVAIQRPEVSALISQKLSGLSYVRSEIDIETSLSSMIAGPKEITTILGNLLDNAIYETSRHKETWIRLKVFEHDGSYVFQITNPGIIPYDIRTKVFELGFTTKGKKGSGTGLYNVKRCVYELGGTVAFHCDAERSTTTFEVVLP